MLLTGLIRLVQRPELSKTEQNVSVSSFTGVFNEKRKTQDKLVEDAHYLDFVIWDKAAEFVCDRFDKGDLIYIESATPRQRKWVDGEGKKHSKIVFRVNSFQRVSRPQRGETEPTTQQE
jgi:single-stranded DNA-binding protein